MTFPGKITLVGELLGGTYVDEDGWRLSVPDGLFLEHSSRGEDISATTVANFEMPTAVGSTGTVYTPKDAQGNFPETGVAFRLLRKTDGPLLGMHMKTAESSFPIDLRTFEPGRARGGVIGTTPTLEQYVIANGQSYIASVWIGPGASLQARSQIEIVASSLSFSVLTSGQQVGIGFYVLESSETYPEGSLTAVKVRERPFVLVNAPGGFYALGWCTPRRHGYVATCEHRVDQNRREISCDRCAARWDRIGRTLIRPAGAVEDDPIDLVVAKVAWDGHVLLHPGTRQRPSQPNADKLWPGWQ